MLLDQGTRVFLPQTDHPSLITSPAPSLKHGGAIQYKKQPRRKQLHISHAGEEIKTINNHHLHLTFMLYNNNNATC